MRPDGDCLGAGFALKHVLQKRGLTADFICDSDAPAHYSFLPGFSSLNERRLKVYDLFLCVDCADVQRLGKFAGYLKTARSVCIDHHATNRGYASENLIDATASSTCEIITALLDESGELDDVSAFCLFVGLSTDTGHFMHSNTSKRTVETAAKLLGYAVDANRVANLLYRNNTIEKTRLIARAISSMRFFGGGKICVITVTQKDLTETGCVIADTEGLTDFGVNIGSTDVTICITESGGRLYKVSFRSKAADVAAAAAVFGGGGHVKAAGCMVQGRYEDVVQKLVKAVTDGADF
jgi:phosphoesterase RecJ-like protein